MAYLAAIAGKPCSHRRQTGHDDRVGQRLYVVGVDASPLSGLLKTCPCGVEDILRNVMEWVIGMVTVQLVRHTPMVTKTADAVEWRWRHPPASPFAVRFRDRGRAWSV